MKWKTRTVPSSSKDLRQLNKLWARNMPFQTIRRRLIKTIITMVTSKLGPNLAPSPTLRDKRWSRALIFLLKLHRLLMNDSHLSSIRHYCNWIIQFSAVLKLVRISKSEKPPQTLATITSVQWVTNSLLLRSAIDKKRHHQVWKWPHRCRPRRNLALMWSIRRKLRKETELMIKKSRVLAKMKLLKLWDFISKWILKKAKRLANVVSQDTRNSKRRMNGMHCKFQFNSIRRNRFLTCFRCCLVRVKKMISIQ